MLIGTKSDLVNKNPAIGKRVVTRDEAENLCKKLNIVTYVETSAKTVTHVKTAYEAIVSATFVKEVKEQYDSMMKPNCSCM